jgi:hypothetical protein
VLWAIGAGRHRRVAGLSLAGGAAAAVLGALLVGPLELSGVAVAVLVGLAPFDLWLIPRAICRELGLSPWRDYLRQLCLGAIAVAPLVLVERFALAPALEDSSVGLVLAAAASLLAAVVATLAALRPSPLGRSGWRPGLSQR